MPDFVLLLLFLWLVICAVLDYRKHEVSNGLTLPPLALAMMARLTGWLVTPWWIIVSVWLAALWLWRRGALGGADAKAWLLFALLSDGVLLGVYLGSLIWSIALAWALNYLGRSVREVYVPAFPGYALGMGVFMLYKGVFLSQEVASILSMFTG